MADKPVILSIFPNSDTKIYVLDPGLTLGPLGLEHSNYLYFLADTKNQNVKIDILLSYDVFTVSFGPSAIVFSHGQHFFTFVTR